MAYFKRDDRRVGWRFWFTMLHIRDIPNNMEDSALMMMSVASLSQDTSEHGKCLRVSGEVMGYDYSMCSPVAVEGSNSKLHRFIVLENIRVPVRAMLRFTHNGI
jgi:hypothetical protein